MTSTTLTIQTPEQTELAQEALSARNTAAIITIENNDDLQFATEQMNKMSKRMKELETRRKEITAPMDQAKKSVMELFKPPIEAYKKAISEIKLTIANYTNMRERELAAERAKAAREAAETRKALEAKAQEAETAEQAEALKEAAQLVVAAPVETEEKVKGMSMRKKWKAEVVDKAAFLMHVAQHPELSECVEIKIGALERFINATGNTVSLPGISTHQETIISSRSA